MDLTVGAGATAVQQHHQPNNPSQRIRVLLMRFRHPQLCYVRSVLNSEKYMRQDLKIHNRGRSAPPLTTIPELPSFAYSDLNGIMHRVKLLAVDGDRIKVDFFDLGHTAFRRLDKLRQITKKVSRWPKYTFKVGLHNVSNYAITSNAQLTFVMQFQGKNFDMVRHTDGHYSLMPLDGDTSINEQIESHYNRFHYPLYQGANNHQASEKEEAPVIKPHTHLTVIWEEDEVEEEEKSEIRAQSPPKKRMIIIDGWNVALAHGGNEWFSVKRLIICIDYFENRGHEVKVVVPPLRLSRCSDRSGMDRLYNLNKIVTTPSVSYNARFVLQLASEMDGFVISNDNFSDLCEENSAIKKLVENRVIGFIWSNDVFMMARAPFCKKLEYQGTTMDLSFLLEQPAYSNSIVREAATYFSHSFQQGWFSLKR